MAIDLFVPPRAPHQRSRTVKPRVNAVMFGDGYSQRSGDGLNALSRTMQLQWTSLILADADAIESFLAAHASTAFRWTPPQEAVERKWICKNLVRNATSVPDVVGLNADIEEVFDL